MRDYLMVAITIGAAPICLFSPYFGVLMWSWIAYFNPHHYTWGAAYNFPVAWVIGIPTLCGAVLHLKQLNRSFLTREAVILLLLWAWLVITTINATQVPEFLPHAANGQVHLVKVSKILLMTFAMMALVTSLARLRVLLYVVALSFGIRAIAAAIFVVRTSGQERVWGPPDSFLADNNAFGLALNMTIPLMYYLGRDAENRWLRAALKLSFYSAVLTVPITYSRGAMLGLAVVLLLLVVRSRKKLLALLLVAVACPLLLTFAPQQWEDRMGNLFVHRELDSSAKQRLVSWGFAWNFVQQYPIAGGGFETFSDVNLYQRYQPEPLPGGFLSSGPHSIYFQMLGEHGFVGLALFLLLLSSCFGSLHSTRRRARGDPSAAWAVPYCDMLQISLASYMASGAFLGLAYFDLVYQMVATVSLVKTLRGAGAEKKQNVDPNLDDSAMLKDVATA